jgi:hypothetical protein
MMVNDGDKTGDDYRSYPGHFRCGKMLGPNLYQTAAIYNLFSGFIWFVPMIFIEVQQNPIHLLGLPPV